MGVTLEFRAGDKSRIAAAVREIDFDALDDPRATKLKADFSLHITPHDLDLLSEAIGELCSKQILRLDSFLTGIVDEDDRGALLVDSRWVAYVAGADSTKVQAISHLWAEKLKAELPDDGINLTEEMTAAVVSLLDLCKRATFEGLEVVHVWFL